MRFGPTSLQLSSVLAKGLRRPKLRSDLRISEQNITGETSYVVKVQETGSFNRYGALEYELLTLCDGTRTAAEVGVELTRRHPDQSLEESDVLEFLDSVEPEAWERSVGEKNLAVLERIRDERRSRLDRSSLLYITFKAWNPDRALARLEPYCRWIFSRGFAVFSIAVFGIALALVAGDWNRIERDTLALYSFAEKTAYDLWAFWIILFALGGIHEFGHGLTCKHYGGEVPQMGFMLIYFTPAFYTDTTDILLFDRVAPRQWTIFAGIWVELVIFSLASLVWGFTLPGSLTNDLAYKTLLLSGIHGTLLNLNPLIKADGYYALAQYLRMDNLREEAFEYLSAWVRKHILRRDVELPASSRRQRRVFFIYSLFAILYGAAIIFISVLFVHNIFVSRMGDWGYIATALLLYLMLRRSLRKALPHARALMWKTRDAYRQWRITPVQGIGAAVIALFLFLPVLSSTVASDFVLEPAVRADVRVPVSGKISSVGVHSGDSVRAGQVLAELTDPGLEARAAILASQLGLEESNLRSAQARAAHAEAAQSAEKRSRLLTEVSVVRFQLEGFSLRAPVSGVVTTLGIEQRLGESLVQGEEFARIADRTYMRSRILVRDWELEEIAAGAAVRLKVRAFPFRTFSGRVDRILPAASADRPVAQPEKIERRGQELTNFFVVEMEFPNPDGVLVEGMTGTAKIYGKRSPLAWRAGRAAWRWVHSQVW
jgi:putative peptide zinc metalloprotease protein